MSAGYELPDDETLRMIVLAWIVRLSKSRDRGLNEDDKPILAAHAAVTGEELVLTSLPSVKSLATGISGLAGKAKKEWTPEDSGFHVALLEKLRRVIGRLIERHGVFVANPIDELMGAPHDPDAPIDNVRITRHGLAFARFAVAGTRWETQAEGDKIYADTAVAAR